MSKTPASILMLQLLFIGASVGLYVLLRYLFGFLVAFSIIAILFVGIILYARRLRDDPFRPFSYRDASFSRGMNDLHRNVDDEKIKIRYSCLLCGEEVRGLRCNKCGSHMKKPVF